MAIVKPIVELSHEYLSQVVQPGDSVIDATVGNGGDTLFLGRLVGSEGKVFGFDLQEQALKNTHAKLKEKGLDSRVQLIAASHSVMAQYVKEPIKAVVFNLGYLPGGDHNITTEAATTLPGLEQGLALLAPGGLLSVSIYWGHPQGEEEKNAIMAFLQQPQAKDWQVLEISVPNRERAPILLIIEKHEKGKNYGK